MRTVIDRIATLCFVAGISLLATAPARADQALNIFACEPHWAGLARILAPDAKVSSATHALQDAHHIEARPALIGAVRRADLAVCNGASLEIGWLPVLLERGANARLGPGKPGLLMASDRVRLIGQQPDAGSLIDRARGDVHPEGNPHFHLDPHNIVRVAEELTSRLQALDPDATQAYAHRLGAWRAQWTERMKGWRESARRLEGRRVVAQHTDFAYLWNWLGMKQVADLEPKPGVPPTAGHLASVLEVLKSDPADVIVIASHQDPDAANWLVSRLGREHAPPILTLPSTLASEGPAATLEGWFDTAISRLLEATSARR